MTHVPTLTLFHDRLALCRTVMGQRSFQGASMTQTNQEPPVRTSRRMRLLLVGVVLAGVVMATLFEMLDEIRQLKHKLLHQSQPPSGEKKE